MATSPSLSIPTRLQSRGDCKRSQAYSSPVTPVCMCGLPNEKFCMLNLQSVVSPTGRSRHRNYTWVPMSICSAYVQLDQMIRGGLAMLRPHTFDLGMGVRRKKAFASISQLLSQRPHLIHIKAFMITILGVYQLDGGTARQEQAKNMIYGFLIAAIKAL
ncbi:hypothetical protein BaRGS_00007543 [Batillaria attramentaria]|uniref:Uncharacterized protein n=1 Tax=Batillaria attramentaria TaxID=370345 RepID=A0ABD0LPB0_9CAEN